MIIPLKSTQRLSYQRGSRNGMKKEMTKVKQLCAITWFVKCLATQPPIWSSLQMTQPTCSGKNIPHFPWTVRQASAMVPGRWYGLRGSSASIAVHPKSSLQVLIPLHKGVCLPKCPCRDNCGRRITYTSTDLALAETVVSEPRYKARCADGWRKLTHGTRERWTDFFHSNRTDSESGLKLLGNN